MLPVVYLPWETISSLHFSTVPVGEAHVSVDALTVRAQNQHEFSLKEMISLFLDIPELSTTILSLCIKCQFNAYLTDSNS